MQPHQSLKFVLQIYLEIVNKVKILSLKILRLLIRSFEALKFTFGAGELSISRQNSM
jgi:hypothetical protein